GSGSASSCAAVLGAVAHQGARDAHTTFEEDHRGGRSAGRGCRERGPHARCHLPDRASASEDPCRGGPGLAASAQPDPTTGPPPPALPTDRGEVGQGRGRKVSPAHTRPTGVLPRRGTPVPFSAPPRTPRTRSGVTVHGRTGSSVVGQRR